MSDKMSFVPLLLIGVAFATLAYAVRNKKAPRLPGPRPSALPNGRLAADMEVSSLQAELVALIRTYQPAALHYQLYCFCNSKLASRAVEKTLFNCYPKVISEPLLQLPESLVMHPEVVKNWLAEHGHNMGEYEYAGRALVNFLQQEAARKAEKIVQNIIDSESANTSA